MKGLKAKRDKTDISTEHIKKILSAFTQKVKKSSREL